MLRRFESILETVGQTPIVRIKKLAPAHVRLYVKIEAFNPMGSVKDRLALGVIEDAERTGRLSPGRRSSRRRSGNTGIGLAMVCAEKGYPLVVTMAENFSVERRKLMRFLGAPGRADAGRTQGQRHARQGGRAGRRARLVPVPAVRQRGERQHALAHDRAGDPRRLRGRAPRLLRHRLRHRRHAQGRRARSCASAAPTPRSSSASRTTRRSSAAASRSHARRTARPPAAIRTSVRT